jgi:hypothetical protein
MISKKLVNKNIIHRISCYRSALSYFKQLGLSRVYSVNLADTAGVSGA